MSAPGYMTIALAQLRSYAEMIDTPRADLVTFLANSTDLPGETAISVTPESISVLIDADGNVLGFK